MITEVNEEIWTLDQVSTFPKKKSIFLRQKKATAMYKICL